jgi:hypothetical protein
MFFLFFRIVSEELFSWVNTFILSLGPQNFNAPAVNPCTHLIPINEDVTDGVKASYRDRRHK